MGRVERYTATDPAGRLHVRSGAGWSWCVVSAHNGMWHQVGWRRHLGSAEALAADLGRNGSPALVLPAWR